MLYIPTATREEMETVILTENSLYAMLDESKFLAEEYSDEEYREVIGRWIEFGDETAGCNH